MTPERVLAIFPRVRPEWIRAAFDIAPGYGIDTPNEMASFLAQLLHESAEFTRLEENLNYSAERLMAVWPKRFATSEAALAYARNPAKLANFVYANRLGNGPPESGDGWRFRGRGPIQITGRSNYTACAADTKIPIVQAPDLLREPLEGITSACWFWKVRDLDRFDDDEDVRMETKLVNGGEHGLAQRQSYMDRLLRALK